ncbi:MULTISPECIES: hypothetical protein [unclassified Nocardia]
MSRALAVRDPAPCALGAFVDNRIVGLGNFIVLGMTRTSEIP